MKAFREAGLRFVEWEIAGFDGHSHGLDVENDTFPFAWDLKLRRRSLSSDPLGGEEAHSNESFIEVEDQSFEESSSEEQLEDSLIEVGAAKMKNKKQKKWVAKALSKLEGSVCKRPDNYFPDSRLVLDAWFTEKCYSNEYRSRSFIPGMAVCTDYCRDHEKSSGDACEHNCGRDGLEHINTGCWTYCAADNGACADRLARIALAFMDVLSNFYPPAKGIAAIKKAATTGSKLALRVAIKKAAKQVAKKLLKKAKKNLKKYMKNKKKELKEEMQDAILEGGIEMVVEARMSKDSSLDERIKKEAEEMAKAVDPTGIADLVDAIEADSCDSKVIEAMPVGGLEDESADNEVHLGDPGKYCVPIITEEARCRAAAKAYGASFGSAQAWPSSSGVNKGCWSFKGSNKFDFNTAASPNFNMGWNTNVQTVCAPPPSIYLADPGKTCGSIITEEAACRDAAEERYGASFGQAHAWPYSYGINKGCWSFTGSNTFDFNTAASTNFNMGWNGNVQPVCES